MTNATHTESPEQSPVRVNCPSWCIREARLDEGTPDECVIHIAEPRHVEGVCLELRQTEFLDGQLEQPFLYLDGAEMSVSAAVRFAAGLISAIAGAGTEGR